MRLNFRQGIVKSEAFAGTPNFITPTPTGLDIITANSPVDVTIAQGPVDYYYSENSDVVGAWPVSPAPAPVWLYWDIDVRTGKRTFGYTSVEPVHGPIIPAVLSDDLHWFDTTENKTKVYNQATSSFLVRIRVFAARYEDGQLYYFPFGSQVGITSSGFVFRSGRLTYDINGRAIRKSDGTFFTTEDQFLVDGSVGQAIRLEASMFFATAQESIPAFSVVKLSNFGQINLADYEDIGTAIVAIASEDAVFGDVITIASQGVITNPSWNWTTPNAELWVDTNGELTDVDPNLVEPLREKQVPIARVISPDTILFEQGLGGKGDKGEPGSISGVTPATTTTHGLVKLATAPSVPGESIAVGTNDPRLTDARTPLAHTHVATDVSTTTFSSYTSTDVQSLFEEIAGEVANVRSTLGSTFGATNLDIFTYDIIPDNSNTKQALIALEGESTNILTLLGTNVGDTNLGIFSHDIIPDNTTVKGALQSLETESTNHILLFGTAVGNTNLGTLSGNLVPDNSSVKGALESLETPIENILSQLWTGSGATNVDQKTSLENFSGTIFTDNAGVKQILQQIETIFSGFTIPYDLGFFISGKPTPDSIVGSFLVTRNVSILAGASGSLTACKVAPTSNISININKNGTTVGTVDFIAASTNGSFTVVSQIDLAPGDIIELETQSTLDPTFENISITIVASAQATILNA